MSTTRTSEAVEPRLVEAPAEEAGPFGLGHSDEKARQILDGAREVFLRDGFDGASMNDIARAAAVSKGTLYTYFQSKDLLFAEMIRHEKRQQAERGCLWAEGTDESLPDTLRRIGYDLITMLIRPENLAQVRTVMAVAQKFPAIGRAFYEAGPKFGISRLATLLDRHVASGEIDVPDTTLAATQFLLLCKADILTRRMFCVGEPVDDREIEATVASAVTVFLRAYGRT